MPDIILHSHLIGKMTPMGSIQCMPCNAVGVDVCFGTPEEFHEHINIEHQTIDFKKMKVIVDETEDQ